MNGRAILDEGKYKQKAAAAGNDDRFVTNKEGCYFTSIIFLMSEKVPACSL